MLAFVLLALLAVCHGQFAKLVFPPAVEFINSDFDMIASGEKAGTGHFDFIRPELFHLFFNVPGEISVEEWIIGDGKGNDEIYVVQNTVCTRGSSPIPPVQCSGWEEDASGVWTQNCVVDNNGGNVDFTCKLANNGQPIWWAEVVNVQPAPPTSARMNFKSTNGVPASNSTFKPPANCPTQPVLLWKTTFPPW